MIQKNVNREPKMQQNFHFYQASVNVRIKFFPTLPLQQILLTKLLSNPLEIDKIVVPDKFENRTSDTLNKYIMLLE